MSKEFECEVKKKKVKKPQERCREKKKKTKEMFLHCEKEWLESSLIDHRERATPQQQLWSSILLDFFSHFQQVLGQKTWFSYD